MLKPRRFIILRGFFLCSNAVQTLSNVLCIATTARYTAIAIRITLPVSCAWYCSFFRIILEYYAYGTGDILRGDIFCSFIL